MARRLLLIDDHVAVRQGLHQMLSEEFPNMEVWSTGNFEELLREVMARTASVVLLDLSMPERNGLDLIHEIKQLSPESAVLVYTVHPESQLGVRCLRAGASGYVTKDRPAQELLAAVRRVSEGRKYISPALAEILASEVAGGGPDELVNRLSDREHQVLCLLASGRSPSEIAAELNLSIKTISTYRVRLLEKLQLQTTADLIRFAIQHRLVD